MLRACRSARDRLIVLLMARAGLRRGEVCGLRRSDVHLLVDSRRWGARSPGRTCMWCAARTIRTGRGRSPGGSGRCRWISCVGAGLRHLRVRAPAGAAGRGQRFRVGEPVPGAARRADAPGRDRGAAGRGVAAGRAGPGRSAAPAAARVRQQRSPMPAAASTWSPTCSVTPRCPPRRCICIRTRPGCGPRWTRCPAPASRPGRPGERGAVARRRRPRRPGVRRGGRGRLAGGPRPLAGQLDRGFSSRRGWDPVRPGVGLPARHPLLGRGRPRCAGRRAAWDPAGGVSGSACCRRRWADRAADRSPLPALPASAGRGAPCRDARGCAGRAGLCGRTGRPAARGASVDEFVADPAGAALSVVGPCQVAACTRNAAAAARPTARPTSSLAPAATGPTGPMRRLAGDHRASPRPAG